MREPIIVEADDGFHFIATRSFAELHYEATDIQNGEYTCFDADGFKLDLMPAPNGAGLISSPDILVDCRSDLEPRLRDFFVRVGVAESEVSKADFAALVQLGADRFLEHPPQPLGNRVRAAIRRFFQSRRNA
jgi:hypothetical protein